MTIKLPSQRTQTTLNLRRWNLLLNQPELARVENRIETDRHGQIILIPLPTAEHSGYQLEIGALLEAFMTKGRTSTECPISTADGVKGAEVAWASPDCLRHLGNRTCYPKCPEICVEVLSPSNTKAEIEEKMALYFDAGAQEVWICSRTGGMSFHSVGQTTPLKQSKLCPKFPKQIVLR